jgi:hypothetical protein
VLNESGEALASLAAYLIVTGEGDNSDEIVVPVTEGVPTVNVRPVPVVLGTKTVFPEEVEIRNVYVALDERFGIVIVYGPVPVFV